MELKVILFDVNGTLVDIETDEQDEEIYRHLSRFLQFQGISVSPAQLKERYFELMQGQLANSPEKFPEFDALKIWLIILEELGSDYSRSLPPEKVAQLPLALAEMHRALSYRRFQLYPDVERILSQLQQNYRLGIVSDAQRAYARVELQALNLAKFFHTVIVSGENGFRKPDPRLFQKALEAVGAHPHEALYVGNDMYRDVFGAQQVGLKAGFFPTQYGEKHYPGTTPDFTINHFSELLEVVRELESGNRY